MSTEAKTRRTGDFMIGSDWITTVGMAVLVVVTAALVILNIRQLVSGAATKQEPRNAIILAIYCFAFAFSTKARIAKVAFALVGAEAAFRVALSYFHTSPSVQHAASLGGLIVSLVALILLFVAIVQWFRFVVRRNVPDSGIPDS